MAPPSDPELPVVAVDLTRATFEEFLAFIFDHDTVEDDRAAKPEWYFRNDLDVAIDPHRQVELLARLFRQADAHLPRYTPTQIEQGFWFMFLAGAEWFMDPLWDPSIPWREREGCILAIPDLYDKLFEHQAVGEAPYMLLDLLAHGFWEGRAVERAGEDDRVRQALFEACRAMLKSSSPETQRAALHGLFHLDHPEGAATIRGWLESGAPGDEIRSYAEDVLAGRAQ